MKVRCIKLFLLLTSIIGCFELFAQNTQYRKIKHEWGKPFPIQTEVESQFQNEDIVIINEDIHLNVIGKKDNFLTIQIVKHSIIKFQTETGIKDNAAISIPETIDPKIDLRHSIERKSGLYPRDTDIEINYFMARIRKKDGRIIDVEMNDQIIENTKLFNMKTYKTYSYIFHINNIEIGDELEVKYSYEVPYWKNWHNYNSKRIFFHGRYPKQKHSFNIRFHDILQTRITNINDVEPDSISEMKKRTILYYSYTNLPGCMNEIGARVHRELPHLVLTLNTIDERLYYSDRIEMQKILIPYWVYFLQRREIQAQLVKLRKTPIIKDPQIIKVMQFIAKQTAGTSNKDPLTKLMKIHQSIVDNFDYQLDQKFIEGIDKKLEKLGDFTEQKILREISRYKLYSRIFTFLDIPYYTLYFMDSRIADMGPNYISPIFDNNFAFVAIINDKAFYFYPKSSRLGFYVDELPFYWENSSALLVLWHTLWENNTAHKPKFIQTHSSNEKDNYRVSSVNATVNTVTTTVNFDARLNLSGQFSTMTRGLYKYDHFDSSVNPLYGKKLWELNKTIRPIQNTETFQAPTFPYQSNFRIKYQASNLIQQTNKKEYSINLKGWFKHIISDSLEAKSRTLNYYPDFLFRDHFQYYIQFDKDVEILDKEQFNVEIKNTFGTLKISLDSLQPNIVLLQSNFIINNEKVLPENIKDIILIQNAIRELNKKKLIFRIRS